MLGQNRQRLNRQQPGENSSPTKPMTFQERIAMERQRQDREPDLPQG